jgi:prefoldin subunit 5
LNDIEELRLDIEKLRSTEEKLHDIENDIKRSESSDYIKELMYEIKKLRLNIEKLPNTEEKLHDMENDMKRIMKDHVALLSQNFGMISKEIEEFESFCKKI